CAISILRRRNAGKIARPMLRRAGPALADDVRIPVPRHLPAIAGRQASPQSKRAPPARRRDDRRFHSGTRAGCSEIVRSFLWQAQSRANCQILKNRLVSYLAAGHDYVGGLVELSRN